MVTPVLELCKVLLRLDMPSAAVEQYNLALQVSAPRQPRSIPTLVLQRCAVA